MKIRNEEDCAAVLIIFKQLSDLGDMLCVSGGGCLEKEEGEISIAIDQTLKWHVCILAAACILLLQIY